MTTLASHGRTAAYHARVEEVTAKHQIIPPPKDWQSFERLCADLFGTIWQDPYVQCNGRLGQAQAGVDVFGKADDGLCGVQCKGRSKDYLEKVPITSAFLRAAVEEARTFEPPLARFILATTAPNSQDIQEVARQITREHASRGQFEVSVMGWDELERRLGDHPKIAQDHGLLPRSPRLTTALSPTGEVFHYADGSTVAALASYSRVLLSTNDIVDLGELSTLDAELAGTRTALRGLYIPLLGRLAPRGVSAAAVADLFISHRRRERRVFHDGEETKDRKDDDATLEKSAGATSPELHTPHPLAQQFERSFRMVLLADPGSGKTTFVRWLVTGLLLRLQSDKAAHQNVPESETLPAWEHMPIVVVCRNLETTDDLRSVQSAIYRSLVALEIAPDLLGPTYCGLWQRICEGRAILLVDGLDEISELAKRESFRAQLQTFSQRFKNVPILITSRIYGYAELGRGIATDFTHSTIDPLGREQKELFAERWSRIAEMPDRATRMAAELKAACARSSTVSSMASNPLMLTTLALVLRTHGSIPERRARLYSEAIDLLLRWRSRTDVKLDPREAIRRLAYIAYVMTSTGRQRLREDEIVDCWTDMSEKLPRFRRVLEAHSPREFLLLLERRSSILVNVGRTYHDGEQQNLYEFRHLSFQDFLTGRAVGLGCYPGAAERKPADQLRKLGGRAARLGESGYSSRWYEPIKLCVGSLDELGADTETLLESILETEGVISEEALYRAAHCLDMLCDDLQVSYDFVSVLCRRFAAAFAAFPYRPSYVMHIALSGRGVGQFGIRRAWKVGQSSWGPIAGPQICSELVEAVDVPYLSHLDTMGMLWWVEEVGQLGFEKLSEDVLSGDSGFLKLARASTLLRFANSHEIDAPADLVEFISEQMFESERGVMCATYALVTSPHHDLVTRDVGALFELCESERAQELLVLLFNAGKEVADITLEYIKSQPDDVLKFLAGVLADDHLDGMFPAESCTTYVSDKFLGRFAEMRFSRDTFVEMFIENALGDGTSESAEAAATRLQATYGLFV